VLAKQCILPTNLKEKGTQEQQKNRKENIYSPNSSLKGWAMPPFRPALSGEQKIHINNPDAVEAEAEIGADQQNGLKLN